MWSQGDDLSVVSVDEVGFRIVEYGRNRRVVLPESVKEEIRNVGQRELRRRGFGQHTIERALNDRVRLSSYKKIVVALANYENDLNSDRKQAIARSKKDGENYALYKSRR